MTARRARPEPQAGGRERLLEAATQLFAERGYAATGVAAICEAAGVAKPALYWHFGSKEELLAEEEAATPLYSTRGTWTSFQPEPPAPRTSPTALVPPPSRTATRVSIWTSRPLFLWVAFDSSSH